MGSPTIFSGNFTKLLTSRGVVQPNGNLIEYSGPRNYIQNWSFDQNITTNGPTLFNTTITSFLPTGSISAGAASLVLSQDTSTPLAGTGSLKALAGSAWLAGEGFYFPTFTVDAKDLGNVITWSLSYQVNAGPNNANWSGVLGSQTLMVYIRDVTNSAWIQPSGFLGMNQNSGAGYVTGTFQSSVTPGQQYSVVVVASKNSTGVISVDFDNIYVGPQTKPVGAAVTDWAAYTPAIQGLGTPSSINCSWRRVGDSAEIMASINIGTPTAVLVQVGLPPGLTSADTSKLLTSTIVGFMGTNVNGMFTGSVIAQPSVSYLNLGSQTTGSGATDPANGNSLFNPSDLFEFRAVVPIAGWSSNVQVSSSTDTRVVAAMYYLPANSTPGAGNPIDYSAQVIDTHAAVTTGAGWKFTAPVSGNYTVSTFNEPTSSATDIKLYKNGSSYVGLVQAAGNGSTSYVVVSLNAGDYISIVTAQGNAMQGDTLNGSGCYISINRLSGPSVIAASESVNARYYSSSSSLSGSLATVTYATKDFDSHNCYSSGVYSIPISGKYQVNVALLITGTIALNNNLIIEIQKNGAVVSRFTEFFPATLTDGKGSMSDIVQCVAGDTIRIQASSSATLPSIVSSNFDNYISISRVGN